MAETSGPMAAFRHRTFTLLWVATVISNTGTWMNEVGAAWLMTTLDPSPASVALVQAASTLPVFLFALLAGAIADLVDRRRMLLVVNLLMLGVATGFALLVQAGQATVELLILATFLLGTGAAFQAPAWQAIVPSLVPRAELKSAIALNSMGINISRAIGPAVAGALIVGVGLAAPFALNAVSFVVILAALFLWRSEPATTGALPKERIGPAIRAGLRYALHSGPLKSALIRAAAFFVFASAFWALLPLATRQSLGGDATLYGILMGAVGFGAVAGALVMPKLRALLGADGMVTAGTLGTAAVLVILATVQSQVAAVAAALLAGLSWIAVLTTLNASAQTSLPGWVRARGLSIFITVFFGCMALGSLLWGQVAEAIGIQTTFLVAAGGAIALIPFVRGQALGQAEAMDLTASAHWPAPVVNLEDASERGPVMVLVEYPVDPAHRDAFLARLRDLGEARRRNGAYDWGVMEHVEDTGTVVEYFIEASWTDHLRHHDRVTGADREIQEALAGYLVDGTSPRVIHLLAPG